MTRVGEILRRLDQNTVAPEPPATTYRVSESGEAIELRPDGTPIGGQRLSTGIEPEITSSEVSPPDARLTLREMRGVVGQNGVTGRHVDGNNESRPTEFNAERNLRQSQPVNQRRGR